MPLYRLESEEFPTCHCDACWTKAAEDREIHFDARHVYHGTETRQNAWLGYDDKGGYSYGEKTYHRFAEYTGTVVALGCDYNMQVMSDVWDNVAYAMVFDVDTLAFRKVQYGESYGRSDAAIDAPAWLIAAYEVFAALAGMVQRHNEAARERARVAELAERERNTPRKGKRVKVVKGRKVPKGTIGEVVWYGQGKRYGYYDAPAHRVGIKDASGETHWTDAKNVQVIHA